MNARQDEREAAIIAQAGERDAVTISTNMAGRGTDIRLGEGVAELGGLHVIGTQKHESRRIDNQLRGRAGRQGDPGSSRFFVSLEDDLMRKYSDLNPDLGTDPDTVQRLVEGHNLDARIVSPTVRTADGGAAAPHPLSTVRKSWRDASRPLLSSIGWSALRTIDDLWSDYLARVCGIPLRAYRGLTGA